MEDKPIVAWRPSYEKRKIAVELLKLNTTVTPILNNIRSVTHAICWLSYNTYKYRKFAEI
jgi:hypothetical protein